MTPSAPLSELGRAALESAAAGLPVFPLRPCTKRPLLKGSTRRATTDLASLEQIWQKHPEANVGVACNRLVVIDVDSEAGERALRRFDLPGTAVVRTPRGRHYYFRGRARNRARVMSGIDIRASCGYVVGAGSIHPSGEQYRWELAPWDVAIAEAPQELLELILGAPAHRSPRQTGRGPTSRRQRGPIEQGSRNTTLTRMAGWLCFADFSEPSIEAALLEENTLRCDPPLPLAEVRTIVRSSRRFDGPPPWLSDPRAFAAEPDLPQPLRHLLWILTTFADHEGVCWPGQQTLADACNVRRKTIGTWLKKLEEAGRISRQPRGQRSDLIRLLPYEETSESSGKW